MTWRGDLWGHRAIVFWKCVTFLAEQLWQNWRAARFFAIYEKPDGGGADNRPPAVLRLSQVTCVHFQKMLSVLITSEAEGRASSSSTRP